MRIDWTPLRAELALWREVGLALPVWWRDDDAVKLTPALDRLMAEAEALGVPLHLAVIPAFAEDSLTQALNDHLDIVPMVHGWRHLNHAPAGEKKAEFGNPRAMAKDDLWQSLTRFQDLFPQEKNPFFVPPWNRIDPDLIDVLPTLGLRGLSTFTSRKQKYAAPDLVQINTHIDPIFWRGGGGLIPPEDAVLALAQTLRDRREGQADKTEPLGLLTHHLVHDEDIWSFSRAVLFELLDGGATAVSLRNMT